MTGFNKPYLVAVTVTYGSRKKLLVEVLDSLQGMVNRIVVVDNGAAWPVGKELGRSYAELVDTVEMRENTGSAGGFSAGIQRALELGAEFVLLLDDDNRPRPDSLSKMMTVWSRESASTDRDRLAILAFRPEHQADVARGVPIWRVNPRSNSFRGFHIQDIAYKLWSRTFWGRPRVSTQGLPEKVTVHQAPYSGLLFHRDVIQTIGLPDSEFVLYADDSEFTWRIHNAKGRIVLVTNAIVDDLESSWNIKKNFSNGFSGALQGSDDFRAYYGMRNGSFFDSRFLKKNFFMFWINRLTYLSVLCFFSFFYKKRKRYRLLKEAVKDGLSGKLGVKKGLELS